MANSSGAPGISIVIVCYEMARELPRTLRSLSPDLQLGVTSDDYEIIVVDNGSKSPPSLEDLRATGAPVREVQTVADAPQSPAHAANIGLEACRGKLVGMFLDGARMASSGMLRQTVLAAKLSERVVISSVGYHLGPTLQNTSVTGGYNQDVEDALLESANWEENPSRLFQISVMAASAEGGCFASMSESHALFMPRELWSELDGYDERFVSPGGGLVNLDVYARSCELPGTLVVTLLSEGTFHQIHDGIASSATAPVGTEFHREYIEIRGKRFSRPNVAPLVLGHVSREVLPHIEQSCQLAQKGISHVQTLWG
ncbi:MAG: glycosyltransferase family A protein [Acidobacteria bacterium]|nr:glycosyltransferase family A protein [Acidobacteriota bacterium]